MFGDSYEQVVATINRLTVEGKESGMEKMETRFHQLFEQYRDFFHRQSDMVAVTSYRHPRFGELMTSYSEVVQHVVNHGTYHCGNLTAMLRQMGYAGVPTDCEFFLFDQNNNGDS